MIVTTIDACLEHVAVAVVVVVVVVCCCCRLLLLLQLLRSFDLWYHVRAAIDFTKRRKGYVAITVLALLVTMT